MADYQRPPMPKADMNIPTKPTPAGKGGNQYTHKGTMGKGGKKKSGKM